MFLKALSKLYACACVEFAENCLIARCVTSISGFENRENTLDVELYATRAPTKYQD